METALSGTVAYVEPDWQPPAGIRALTTIRSGAAPGGLVPPSAEDLARMLDLPSQPKLLHQVHGARVVEAGCEGDQADASFSRSAGTVCAVQTADCLPVFLTDRDGACVALAHAGWRGIARGVIESTVAALDSAPAAMIAGFGPAIGPDSFEVGDDVYEQMTARNPRHRDAFTPLSTRGKYLCDIYRLAVRELAELGVPEPAVPRWCTVREQRFYSHRRDPGRGRMVSLIWINGIPGGAGTRRR